MATRTWVGGGSNAAKDPTQWSPAGAPQAGDTLNMSAGTINITDDDLAGDTLNLMQAPSSFQPFQVDIGLVNGSTNIGFDTNQFKLTTTASVVSHLVGGDGVGFNGAMTLGGDVTFSGTANFVAGFSINGSGDTFTDNGTIVDSVGTLTANLDGTGTIEATRFHDGPGRVEVNGSVASSLNFTLAGDSGGFFASLIIDQPLKFDAPITVLGINPGGQPADAILTLKGITATAYAFDDNTLVLLNNDQIADTIKLNAAQPFEVDQVGGDVSVFFNMQGSGTKLPGFLNPPFPAPYTPPNFDIVDMNTDQGFLSAGQPYNGPVAGIDWQLIEITEENLNITAVVPNVFIHGGSGNDALDVSATPATDSHKNILDGSTGSNFLVGATTGLDEFYVDDRSPSEDIWTTIRNLHGGDDATIWGLTPSDFVKTSDNVLPTSPGLTFSVAGTPNVNLTIEGYSTDDLKNGRLSVAFGRTPDLPGLPGSDFMQIHANG